MVEHKNISEKYELQFLEDSPPVTIKCNECFLMQFPTQEIPAIVCQKLEEYTGEGSLCTSTISNTFFHKHVVKNLQLHVLETRYSVWQLSNSYDLLKNREGNHNQSALY